MKKVLVLIAIFAFAIFQPAYAYSLIIRGGQLIIRGGQLTIATYVPAPPPALIIPAYVQEASNGTVSGTCNSSATMSLNLSNVTTGDMIFIAESDGDTIGVTPTVSVSDNKSNTYTGIDSASYTPSEEPGGFTNNLRTYYAKAVTGGSVTITVTFTGCGFSFAPTADFVAMEYSGLNATAPVDVHNAAAPGTGSPNPTNSVTTSAANDIVVILGGDDDDGCGTPTHTPSSGFTDRYDGGTSGCGDYGSILYIADKLQTTAGSVSGSFTINDDNGNENGLAIIDAFKK